MLKKIKKRIADFFKNESDSNLYIHQAEKLSEERRKHFQVYCANMMADNYLSVIISSVSTRIRNESLNTAIELVQKSDYSEESIKKIGIASMTSAMKLMGITELTREIKMMARKGEDNTVKNPHSVL